MIAAPLAGIVLVIQVALGPALDPDPSLLSEVQKGAAVRPLARRSTDCIARSVAADPPSRDGANKLADLIVESMPACIDVVRAMVEGYDRYFGEGSGEAFFIGPYLEILPSAVSERCGRDKAAPSLRAECQGSDVAWLCKNGEFL
jgi:hypothetical protein